MNTAAKYFYQAVALTLVLSIMLAQPGQAAKRTGRVVVPDNGYATGTAYGSGWKCNFGFVEVRGACTAVVVPANGFLSERGDRWRCDRGYRQGRDDCQAIEVPANGYLNGKANKGWNCERGYRATRVDCELVHIPANAYPTNSAVGDPWKCERGYREYNKACVEIVVPDYAYLDYLPYGPGWQCERGYVSVDSKTCKEVRLPADAHLSRNGNDWECNQPYRKQANGCVIRDLG